jgi:hypothetical protein
MNVARHAVLPELGSDGRRPEPRWMTLADLGVIIAAVALALTIPARALGLPIYLSPQTALLFFVLIGGLRLTVGLGLVLAFVVLFRHIQYGRPVRPAEWLALGLASLGLLDAIPNLDAAVNAYYVAVGSTALDFGAARWLMSAPAAAGVVLIVAGLIHLNRRTHDASRCASALTVVGIVSAMFLWFWGPCEVVRLELPWLLIPSPDANPSSWGWWFPAILALRELVANGLMGLTWGLPAAAAVRAWRDDRRRGLARAWIWTELAAFVDGIAVALLMLTLGSLLGPTDLVMRVPWIVGVGLVSWWITGRVGFWRDRVNSGGLSAFSRPPI